MRVNAIELVFENVSDGDKSCSKLVDYVEELKLYDSSDSYMIAQIVKYLLFQNWLQKRAYKIRKVQIRESKYLSFTQTCGRIFRENIIIMMTGLTITPIQRLLEKKNLVSNTLI